MSGERTVEGQNLARRKAAGQISYAGARGLSLFCLFYAQFELMVQNTVLYTPKTPSGCNCFCHEMT
jgi:hypothetical protein